MATTFAGKGDAGSAVRPGAPSAIEPGAQSNFHLRRVVTGGSEVVFALGGGEGVEQIADDSPEPIDRALGCLAQQCFELGEGHLN